MVTCLNLVLVFFVVLLGFFKSFNLIFNWADFFFLLTRVLELGCVSTWSSKGRVPLVPAPASSSRSCCTLFLFAALATLWEWRWTCHVLGSFQRHYASWKHVLCSPSGGAPQVVRVPVPRGDQFPPHGNSRWLGEVAAGLFLLSQFDYFSFLFVIN